MDTNNVTIQGCPGAPPASATPTGTPAVPGLLPGGGGAPLQNGGFPWIVVLVASVMGGLGAVVLVLSVLGVSAPVRRRRE